MYDLIVIGGGPAGMMAAGRAAERGKKVLLLEKNPGLGKKLLITGGGRCNVTNNPSASLGTSGPSTGSTSLTTGSLRTSGPSGSLGTSGKTEVRTMVSKYKGNDQFLFSAFAQFSVKDALSFFNSRGMATKVENEGRVFPVSDSAKSVFDVLVEYMKEGGVKVQTGAEVTELSIDSETKNIVISAQGGSLPTGQAGASGGEIKKIIAKVCVLATGGISRPETGSTGEGFLWLKKLGHTIIENDFALVPVALSDAWAKKLGGVTLKDIKLTTFQNGEKQAKAIGKLLFTHFGVSGPTVLNMSKEIGELLNYGEVVIEIDLFPRFDLGALRKQLQELLTKESNKKIKNVLGKLIPAALASALLKIANVDGETANHSVSTESRKKLVALMKAIPLHVSGLLGADKAIVSSGGVALEEVNFKTMQSRLVPNLYLVGDVLNIDRPSGGYSLQLCWTTGFVAGNSISLIDY